ncbi:MAG: recombinase family protein [Proteobacteria bacterium]|nr:recombinase family protein [Pseudomonadota bacterium]
MKLGYIRVSTDDQMTARQIDRLKAICDEVVIETVSAAARSRPVYKAVLQRLSAGDSFVIWDLDYAFRSTVDALLEAEKLRERRVHFQIANLNVDTATPEGELYYTIVAAFARFERRTLIRRTKEGLEVAKKRGTRLGRPPALSVEQIAHARAQLDSGAETVGGMASVLKVDRGTLRRALARGQDEADSSFIRASL